MIFLNFTFGFMCAMISLLFEGDQLKTIPVFEWKMGQVT